MDYKIEPYDQLLVYLESLGCRMPDGIAFLPENLNDSKSPSDFIFLDSTSELKKILRQGNCQYVDLSEAPPRYRVQKNDEWICPMIFH